MDSQRGRSASKSLMSSTSSASASPGEARGVPAQGRTGALGKNGAEGLFFGQLIPAAKVALTMRTGSKAVQVWTGPAGWACRDGSPAGRRANSRVGGCPPDRITRLDRPGRGAPRAGRWKMGAGEVIFRTVTTTQAARAMNRTVVTRRNFFISPYFVDFEFIVFYYLSWISIHSCHNSSRNKSNFHSDYIM